ncbi:transposase [Pseudomonas putida]|uniref:transposase n=1 Tax=Pseudomonas putida TaxID=303 RepID=UPI0022713C64|nr:transposase [Pseudomonas putida]WAB99246.1 transposase [Pseudomonas putida]
MRQRSSYPKPFKAQVVQECLQPGATGYSVAINHGINANVIRKWLPLYRDQPAMSSFPAFVPLNAAPERPVVASMIIVRMHGQGARDSLQHRRRHPMALDVGAVAHSNWSGCHAVSYDLNAQAMGDLSRLNQQKNYYHLGVVVNADGQRFVGEGEDFRNYTYSGMGAKVMEQSGGIA